MRADHTRRAARNLKFRKFQRETARASNRREVEVSGADGSAESKASFAPEPLNPTVVVQQAAQESVMPDVSQLKISYARQFIIAAAPDFTKLFPDGVKISIGQLESGRVFVDMRNRASGRVFGATVNKFSRMQNLSMMAEMVDGFDEEIPVFGMTTPESLEQVGPTLRAIMPLNLTRPMVRGKEGNAWAKKRGLKLISGKIVGKWTPEEIEASKRKVTPKAVQEEPPVDFGELQAQETQDRQSEATVIDALPVEGVDFVTEDTVITPAPVLVEEPAEPVAEAFPPAVPEVKPEPFSWETKGYTRPEYPPMDPSVDIREAVNVLNEWKGILGDKLSLTVTAKGTLVALAEFGE